MTIPPNPHPEQVRKKPPVINERQRDLLREIAGQPIVYGEVCPYSIPLSAADRDSPSLVALRKKGLITIERNFARLTDAGQQMVAACDALFGKGTRHHV